jgi:hypothetical protein
MANRNWIPILNEAERIANSYTTPVTLRQLHYRLVASGVGGYENTQTCYKQLSSLTAEERRAGRFPQLSDRTRGVERPSSWRSPASAIASMIHWYRRDRTEGQDYQIWVLYEKATLGAQIEAWSEEYSVPTAALRGYSSESLEREIFEAMDNDGRPVVVFYVGDLDPEGEDIERNFREQADRQGIEFEYWDRLTVLPAQIGPLGLVPNPGKATSSRAPGFVRKYGRLFQIETEAVDPAELERLVRDALTHSSYFDEDVRQESLAQEKRDIQKLKDLRDSA